VKGSSAIPDLVLRRAQQPLLIVHAIDRMGLSEETLDKIAFENAERIYGRILI
jgi:hypothetical protein